MYVVKLTYSPFTTYRVKREVTKFYLPLKKNNRKSVVKLVTMFRHHHNFIKTLLTMGGTADESNSTQAIW